MTLTELLNSIANTKAQIKSKLGTSSDALDQYPTLISNFLFTQYNDGYKAGWQSVKGTAYSGNKKTLLTVTTTTPSWQGQDTTQLSTLVNVMSGIRSIRESMREALGIQYEDGCNVFSTYPDYLTVTSSHNSTSRADQEYQLGYAAGVQDANSSTPLQSPTPIISVSENTVWITCSSCTSLTWWFGSAPTSAKANAQTQTGTTVTFNITEAMAGKYVRAHSNTNGMNTSDYATYPNPLVYTPSEPVVEIPAAPTFSSRVSTQNVIGVSAPSGTYIKYTINGGAFWNTITSNSGTIVIPTSGIAAGNLQAKCYLISNTSVESNVTTYPSALPYYNASQPDEPVDDMSAVPFYIMTTNISGTYQIKATQNRFHVSTKTDFSTLVTPTTSATVDKWTLQPNTIYYIKKHFSSTDLPKDGSLELANYTGGMYVNFGGNLLSLAEFDWENFTPAAGSADTWIGEQAFRSMFTSSNWKYSIKDVSNLYFPPGSYYGYAQMFSGCTNLTDGPSTISCGSRINSYQFYETFKGCTKLTNAAALTSTSVETSGCEAMYSGCSLLTTAGDISATYVGQAAFKNMFYHCTNLVTAPSQLKSLSLSDSCYYQMFDTCSKLVNAPKILATTISASQCMKYMFYSCAALKSINVCFTNWSSTISSTGSTYRWCGGSSSNPFSSSGTFTIGGRGSWSPSDHENNESGIPEGWRWIDNRGIELEPEINI